MLLLLQLLIFIKNFDRKFALHKGKSIKDLKLELPWGINKIPPTCCPRCWINYDDASQNEPVLTI